MTPDPLPDDPRLLELLADRAVFGLSADEQAELREILTRHGRQDSDELDGVAAAIYLALAEVEAEPMPAGLTSRLERQAVEFFRPAVPVRTRTRSWPLWLAAAALLLAALGWWPRLQPLLQSPLRSGPGVIEVAWAPGPDSIGQAARGEVLWSTAEQRGEMRLSGLPRNDPQAFQYQLWIFDRNQDEATPVDGGVFDIAADGTVVIPIDAKLKVVEPYLFAITVEKPGGVVRSTRERLALVAAVSG